MQPSDKMPIMPYPAFYVGRHAAQAAEIIHEAEINAAKEAEKTDDIEVKIPPNLDIHPVKDINLSATLILGSGEVSETENHVHSEGTLEDKLSIFKRNALGPEDNLLDLYS